MSEHITFFKKLNNKRPLSQSIDEQDTYIKDIYLDWIKEKMGVYLASPKSYNQLFNKIKRWMRELDLVHQEKIKTIEELTFLTQKLHDKGICMNILVQLLDFIEEEHPQNKQIDKKAIFNFLNGLYDNHKKVKPSEEENTDINKYQDSDTDTDSDSNSDSDSDNEEVPNANNQNPDPSQIAGIIISFPMGGNQKNNPFLDDWNKRFEEIRNKSSKNMSLDTCHEYLNTLAPNDREKLLTEAERVEGIEQGEKPMYFKILDLPIPLEERKNILREYNSLSKSGIKGKTWLNRVMSLPFGKYEGSNMEESNTIKKFIRNLKKTMDEAVYGHDDVKNRIIQILCQSISNPNAKGLVMGIEGPPGIGKTQLIETGISKVMGRPFIPISLGGASDASFLEGHSFTYEGSIPGKIAESIIQAKCMNPIFYFDELDKVSKTAKGMEIINLLVHLIDPVQNYHFNDKYFHGVSIDLSKATFIFSFNDRSLVDRILLDRITVIRAKGLDARQKTIIAQKYLLRSILKEMGRKERDITISDEFVTNLIEKFTFEGGVRKLKEILFHLAREFNVLYLAKRKLGNDTKKFKFPYHINSLEQVKTLMTDYREMTPIVIHDKSKIGLVNGLWANMYGIGGILPIELMTFPSHQPFAIKKTGSLEKVIKESVEVAQSVSWNYLSDEKKKEWTKYWKENTEGFHIHCPDGATPKDGPSAGTALTLLFYSYLTKKTIPNTLALTGEMNLQGKVGEIGGLKEKTYGALKAGVKLMLYPKDNQKDMDKIIKENPNILDKMKVKSIEEFKDVLEFLE